MYATGGNGDDRGGFVAEKRALDGVSVMGVKYEDAMLDVGLNVAALVVLGEFFVEKGDLGRTALMSTFGRFPRERMGRRRRFFFTL